MCSAAPHVFLGGTHLHYPLAGIVPHPHHPPVPPQRGPAAADPDHRRGAPRPRVPASTGRTGHQRTRRPRRGVNRPLHPSRTQARALVVNPLERPTRVAIIHPGVSQLRPCHGRNDQREHHPCRGVAERDRGGDERVEQPDDRRGKQVAGGLHDAQHAEPAAPQPVGQRLSGAAPLVSSTVDSCHIWCSAAGPLPWSGDGSARSGRALGHLAAGAGRSGGFSAQFALSSGRIRRSREPPSGSLAAVMSPPWRANLHLILMPRA